ncbi:hypothetical protein ACX9I7_26625 [Streptomyces sp. L500]|uniref:hypothetical protein n=1 Tax=Streptomyces abikoensis TaxID=97398 RepID=UPI003683A358
MNADKGIDVVEFACAHCGLSWTHEYEVVRCATSSGFERECFSIHDLPVMPPYSWEGAPECSRCGHWVVGKLAMRRS